MVKELSQNFKETLAQENKPYILEMYTPTCGTCQKVMPLVEEVEAEHGDSVAFYKINVEAVPEVADEYNVTSAPTLLFVKEGEVVEKHQGNITKEEIVEKLKKSFK